MGFLSSLYQNVGIVLDWIFPPAPPWRVVFPMEGNLCGRCGHLFEIPHEVVLESCANCQKLDWHLDRAFSCYLMKGDPREAILEFKYQRQFHWRRRLGESLAEGYAKRFKGVDFNALVPVPLHSSKQRDRGFNQAEELALVLSKRVGVPVLSCLGRRHETIAQAGQNREGRIKGQNGSFEFMREFDVRGSNLLLIDDVLTTGTTANECARVLREAGARYVAVLTVARGV